MGFFLETVFGGLMAGMLYALVALGFVLIFKASGVFNFAQGAMVLFAALAMARQVALDEPDATAAPGSPGRASAALTPAQDRELLAELMRSRVAVRRFGTNVNQAVAALHSGQEPPVWLEQAVVGGDRAVARVDAAAAALVRRLV